MKVKLDLSALKKIPISEVAKQLVIQVYGAKVMCFTGHDLATPRLSFQMGNSKAVHEAYARNALVVCPPIDERNTWIESATSQTSPGEQT